MIQNVTAEDSGNYSCGARDGAGQQFFLITVNSNSTSGERLNKITEFIQLNAQGAY